MEIADCRAFEISEDGNLIVEIPSARPGDKEFREQLKWDWLELAAVIKRSVNGWANTAGSFVAGWVRIQLVSYSLSSNHNLPRQGYLQPEELAVGLLVLMRAYYWPVYPAAVR